MRSVEAIWRDEDARSRKRWTVSFAIVLGLHIVPLVLAGKRMVASEPAPVPPAAIMIDMAPTPAAPPRAVQPQVEPPKPRPIVRPPLLLPQLPRISNAAATLASDPHPDQHSQDVAAQPSPPPAAMTAPPAPAAVRAESSQEPAMSAPNWQSLLLGRLQRFMRYPAEAQARRQQGVALLRFTMDRTGRVLTYRLERSSGYDQLDQETLALIQRAQPLPKPPSTVPGDPVELVVPIEFSLRRRW